MSNRKNIKLEIRLQVLHEAGYKCSVPTCRTILTLDIHHLVYVSDKGSNDPANLLALCPNCHALHHRGEIPSTSLRAWKMFLLSLNEAFDRRSIDMLLALDTIGGLSIQGEGILSCASLIAANLVEVQEKISHSFPPKFSPYYYIKLNEKGRTLVKAWKRGEQESAVV
jgi:hypothetical protein